MTWNFVGALPCADRLSLHHALVLRATVPPTGVERLVQRLQRPTNNRGGVSRKGKGVFSSAPPLVRSRIGMLLQEQFGLFAANFVRWAAQWAKQLVRPSQPGVEGRLTNQTLVQDVSHCRARLVKTMLWTCADL